MQSKITASSGLLAIPEAKWRAKRRGIGMKWLDYFCLMYNVKWPQHGWLEGEKIQWISYLFLNPPIVHSLKEHSLKADFNRLCARNWRNKSKLIRLLSQKPFGNVFESLLFPYSCLQSNLLSMFVCKRKKIKSSTNFNYCSINSAIQTCFLFSIKFLLKWGEKVWEWE